MANEKTNVIRKLALEAVSKNPVEIATGIMKDSHINMHGPEHHFLVAASLLAAYKNAGGGIDLPKALDTAAERANSYPGGICGAWGCCGAAIASGIAVCVITNTTPFSMEDWSAANTVTSKSLAAIAANGGPRCCKRDSLLAISHAAKNMNDYFDVKMELPDKIVCGHSGRNEHCRRAACPFYAE